MTEQALVSTPLNTEVVRTRVLLLSTHFAEYALRLSKALSPLADLLVVVYHENASNELGPDYERRFAGMGVRCLALSRPTGPHQVPRNFAGLRRAVAAFSPQLVHMQEDLRDELVLGLLTLPTLRALPLVLTVHDPQPHSGRDARALRWSRHRLYRWLVRRKAHRVVTHGQHLVTLLERDWPSLRGQVRSIAHGPLGPEQATPQTSHNDGLQRLLFFGRIHAYKGLAAFVAVVKAAHQRGLPVRGVVAGRGEDLELHRADMEAAGCFEIHDRYIPAAEVDALFAQASLVVLPYTDGTQSGVAALALGYGRPVVATRVGAIPELVRDGINGLLVPPGDSKQLQAAVERLLEDEPQRQRLTAGAAALAAGALSWHQIARQTAEVYAGLLGEY